MTPRILVLSFSRIAGDARVLRHVQVLAEGGEVTTCGYGPAPQGAHDHVPVEDGLASLPQTPAGVALLAARRYAAAERAAPAVRQALQRLAGRRFDLVVANDARSLPVALDVAAGAPVWADMHEWAPQERTQDWRWRLLVAPFADALCRRYLPRCAATTTVAGAIARMYSDRYGVPCEVVRNTPGYQELEPTPVAGDRVRMVHSGGSVPGRSIETLLEVTAALPERFTLDLYLVPGGDGGRYHRRLSSMAARCERIRMQEPVPPASLPAVLNRYDVGLVSLPPLTVNAVNALPNKFFDYVQARLAVVVPPLHEMASLVRRHGLGAVTTGPGTAPLAATLRQLDEGSLARCKQAASVAARELSSQADRQVVLGIVSRLLPGHRAKPDAG